MRARARVGVRARARVRVTVLALVPAGAAGDLLHLSGEQRAEGLAVELVETREDHAAQVEVEPPAWGGALRLSPLLGAGRLGWGAWGGAQAEGWWRRGQLGPAGRLVGRWMSEMIGG